VVVYVPAVGRYFPQDNPADVQADGEWSSKATIGIASNAGLQFDIRAVIADKDAQDSFQKYLAQAKAAGSWSGLDRLPQGAVIYDRITVTRK